MSRMPGFSTEVRPSRRAHGARVNPWANTVATTTAKVVGIISGASTTPLSRRATAKRLETATATMPRGAIQPIKSRSANVMPVPMVAANTAIGRITNITIATNATVWRSSCRMALRSRAAVSRRKRLETSRIVIVSLNRRISVRLAILELASRIPITVTVKRPASSSTRLVSALAAITVASMTAALRYSGTKPLVNAQAIVVPAAYPPATAVSIPAANTRAMLVGS